MLSNSQLIKSFLKYFAYVVLSFVCLNWSFVLISAKSNMLVLTGVLVVAIVTLFWCLVVYNLYLKRKLTEEIALDNKDKTFPKPSEVWPGRDKKEISK